MDKERITYFHIVKPFYYYKISTELTPHAQTLFHAILYKFNSLFFPLAVKISSRELADLTGLSYTNLAAIRKQLTDYRINGEWIIKCVNEIQGTQPFYYLNYDLFIKLYNGITAEIRSDIIPMEAKNILAEQESMSYPQTDILDKQDQITDEQESKSSKIIDQQKMNLDNKDQILDEQDDHNSPTLTKKNNKQQKGASITYEFIEDENGNRRGGKIYRMNRATE